MRTCAARTDFVARTRRARLVVCAESDSRALAALLPPIRVSSAPPTTHARTMALATLCKPQLKATDARVSPATPTLTVQVNICLKKEKQKFLPQIICTILTFSLSLIKLNDSHISTMPKWWHPLLHARLSAPMQMHGRLHWQHVQCAQSVSQRPMPEQWHVFDVRRGGQFHLHLRQQLSGHVLRGVNMCRPRSGAVSAIQELLRQINHQKHSRINLLSIDVRQM